MKNFIENFKNSLQNHSFYKEKANAGHSTGYGYLVKLALLVAVVFYIIIVCGFYFSGMIGKIKKEVNQKISENVSVYIDKTGQLSINQPTPYVISMPEVFKEDKQDEKNSPVRANLIVIDPTREVDDTVFSAYDTMIFISKYRLLTEKSSNGEIRSYPLKSWADTTITKNTITGFLNTIYEFGWILMILMIIPFFVMFFVTYLFTAFFASIVLYFLAKKVYKPLTFRQIMNTAMFGYTYAFLVGILISIFSFNPFSGFFWAKVLITIIVTTYFLAKKDKMPQMEVNNASASVPIATDNANVV